MKIPEELRTKVELQAGHKCEYCQTIMDCSPTRFEVEHILPLSKSGLTILINLALACRGCNLFKYNKIFGIDELTGATAPLFNPREDDWKKHFAWDITNPLLMVGLTATGRATISTLKLNRNQLISVRTFLFKLQMHPPN